VRDMFWGLVIGGAVVVSGPAAVRWVYHGSTDWQRAWLGIAIGAVAIIRYGALRLLRIRRRKARARELLWEAVAGFSWGGGGIEAKVRQEWAELSAIDRGAIVRQIEKIEPRR